jgi:hypothetical protein
VRKLVPLTGLFFVILVVVGGALTGEPPEADESVQKIVDHYVDNDTTIMIGSMIGAVAITLFIFFANYLRIYLREAPTSATILVGAAIIAVGFGVDLTIGFALADKAEDVDPTAVQALQTLWDNDFIPIVTGMLVFLVSLAAAILRTGLLPKWMAWVALVLLLAGPTPAGFFAFMATGVLIAVISVMLALRERSDATPPPAPAGGPPSG